MPEAVSLPLLDDVSCAVVIRSIEILTDMSQLRSMFDRAMDRFGRLDVLINNAGMVIKKPFVAVTEEKFDRIFAINAKAPFSPAWPQQRGVS